MAVNNTLSVKEYALTGGGTDTFPITFEFTTDDNGDADNIHCQLAEKNDEGEYTSSVELTEGVAGDFQVDGGNVKFLDDAGMAGKFLVIYRSTPVTQLTDFIDNGNYSLEDIERALDKLTFILQERTGTPVGTYINVGVSLFFATLLQLTQKKDVLENLFTWNDIDVADRPGLAGTIRSVIDAVTKSGDETIGGHKTFTYSPRLANDPQTNDDATRKSYVDSAIAAKFPVVTANIGNSQVTSTKIADGNVTNAKLASGAVTTAKIVDGNVTTAKIADSNITFGKFRTGSATVTMTKVEGEQEWDGTWSNGGNKILYGVSSNVSMATVTNNGSIKYAFHSSHSGNITVYYVY